jgi:hypothetical protein
MTSGYGRDYVADSEVGRRAEGGRTWSDEWKCCSKMLQVGPSVFIIFSYGIKVLQFHMTMYSNCNSFM